MKSKKKKWVRTLSVLVVACVVNTACNDNSLADTAAPELQVAVQVADGLGRAVITGDAMPDGSSIGIGAGGAVEAENVRFTAIGSGVGQKWQSSGNIFLDTAGQVTVYAYYPYQSTEDFDMTAIPVDVTASQTDWLWATPDTGVDSSSPQASLTMNHALTGIRLVLAASTYQGSGNGTSLSIRSDGLALAGTLNAHDGSFSGLTGVNDVYELGSFSLNTSQSVEKSCLVIPSGRSATLVFSAVVDGYTYQTTSADVLLEAGNFYTYTLHFNGQKLTIGTVSLTPFSPSGDIGLDFTVSGQ